MKKDENRFTIRFNSADPRQKSTRDVLSAAGRRKAALITDAVCEYITRHGEYGVVELFSSTPTSAALSAVPISPHIPTTENSDNDAFSQVLELVVSTEDAVNVETDIINDSEDSELSDDLRNAVINGLSAFKL